MKDPDKAIEDNFMGMLLARIENACAECFQEGYQHYEELWADYRSNVLG
jgi:hypothetical protein